MKSFAVFSGTGAALFSLHLFLFPLCGTGTAKDFDHILAKVPYAVGVGDVAELGEPGKKGDGRAVDALMRIVEQRRDDWELQASAIRLLGEIANPVATDLLIRVVTDHFFTNDCPALKWNGIVALGNFRNDSRVVDALLYRLNEDTLYLREAVIQSLGKIGDREALPYLIGALSDRRFAVRFSAVKALGAIRDPRAIPFLVEVMDADAESLIREEAAKIVEGLRKIRPEG
jgi:HEAT repeat protein